MFIYPNTTSSAPFQPKAEVTDNVLLAFGIPIFLANLLGIIVVWQSTKLPFQIRLLTLNMSYADGGIGLFMLFPRRWLYQECNIRKYLLEIMGTSSFLTITAFNVDRCLIIFYAIHYTMFITKSRIFTVCVVIWIFSLLIVYLLYSNEELETLGFSCEEAFTGDLRTTNIIGHIVRATIIIMNVIIMIVLCLYLRNRMKVMSHTGSQQFKTKHWDYQVVTVKKILLITMFFTVLYTPYMICQLFVSTHIQTRSDFILKALSALASMLNSFINPFLYIFRFKECRFQLKLLFCRWNKSLIEETERERKQSFASYTIDDSMKLRLQAIHNNALKIQNSETFKTKLQAIEGKDSGTSKSILPPLEATVSRTRPSSLKSVTFAVQGIESETTPSKVSISGVFSKTLENGDSTETDNFEQEDTVLQTF
uniref:Adrenocorticotropic hormone receptor-like n=1 Tax=Crassostrea virginica TaxID=6565 RepID=A0A8B8D8S9_CRAVI|nr:adrenocorticotropic hormone receptor-like [Crassostrea virginica]XP_022324030.1 adrenocorticotropic hormone receptor-like [Crassostrea virginica]